MSHQSLENTCTELSVYIYNGDINDINGPMSHGLTNLEMSFISYTH